ncbi:chain length determinant protein, partial [Streptomyces erythrochromogenes]|uniref:chain length determinant protein n=1 Tax=Streptomyces erythrochromogenes TaxID=285574 RepID=UPI0036D02018
LTSVSINTGSRAPWRLDGNPFLSTQTSLTGMADGLARNLNSDGAKADLKALGVTGRHEVKIADNAQGPFMWLTVTGTDPAAVLTSDELLAAYADKRLKEFQTQQSVAPEAMIRMATIVPPQKPEAQTKTRLQYLVMVGALGFVLSLVAVFFVEARRRTPRGKNRPAPAATPSAEAAPVPVGAAPAATDETMALRTVGPGGAGAT